MMTGPINETATLRAEQTDDGALTLRLAGRLDSTTCGRLWREVDQSLSGSPPTRAVIEAGEITYCDGSGIALLFNLKLRGLKAGVPVEIRSLRPEFQTLLDAFDEAAFAEAVAHAHKHVGLVEEVGKATVHVAGDVRFQITFLGELCAQLTGAILKPWSIRWKDALLVAERAGANAVGIVALIGFLFGLILAFSSAMPLRQYGAELYVSDLVALALARVLGPVVTAIVFAGRTGSAFAAELGTMKINNELDALDTMGLDSVRFLVVPRVLASVVVMPLLTVLANVAGLIGTALVILSLGFPMQAFLDRVQASTSATDWTLGLGKTLVYAALVSGVSCLRGLQTETGPSAVGVSATRAVVSSIVLIVIAEGVFSVMLHYTGI